MPYQLRTLLRLYQGGAGCVLHVYASSSKSGSQEQTVISLQARSRRETNLWGEILQVDHYILCTTTTL
jgi:hypothetical protein